MTFKHHYEPRRLLMTSFKLWTTFLISQLDSWPKNQLYWGKSQPWPIYSQTSWFLIHINILDSYVSFYQVWITIPQEMWSNHQKGKMVKIRVLIEERQFLIFNLENDQLISSMISRIQWHHLDLITWLKTSQIHWIDRWNL